MNMFQFFKQKFLQAVLYGLKCKMQPSDIKIHQSYTKCVKSIKFTLVCRYDKIDDKLPKISWMEFLFKTLKPL